MGKLKAFCAKCFKEVPCTVCSERVETAVHGATIRYIELTARCPFCGDEVYAPLINDANVEARLNAYRRQKGETQIIKCSPEEFYGGVK